MNKYQQGDVLFVELDKEERESFKSKKAASTTQWQRIRVDREENGDTVVAYGEATGHNHRFQFDSKGTNHSVHGYVSDMGRTGETNALQYVEISKTSTLTHQEHNPIQVPPGKYRIKIVKEFDHIGQVTRNVVD